MGRLRGARPGARRHRQGGDRARHPDRAHADRRRGARRRARAGAHRVGSNRRQPGRGLHLGQLFDRGRRRFDPAGLRRGARAVPRPRRRAHRLPGRRAHDRGRSIPAGRPRNRPRLLVGRRRGQARAPRKRHRADQAALDLPGRRPQPAAPRPAGEAHRRSLHPRHRARGCRARAGAAAALARRPPRRARRERGAQGRQGADRDPARGRFRRVHGRQRDRGHARRRGRPHARALGRRRAGAG